MRTLAIARLAVLRLLRDRSNLFFVFIFPLALVLLIGMSFGGSQDRHLAVVGPGDAAAEQLTAALADEDGVAVDRYEQRSEALDSVAAGEAAAALILPDDYGVAVAGDGASAELVLRPDGTGEELRPIVSEAIGEQSAARTAAAVAAELTGRPEDALLSIAESLVGSVSAVAVEELTVEGDPLAAEFSGLGQFELGATSQLVLFVFLTSLTAAAGLIQERRLGVVTRMLSTPTHTREIVLGTALGRFGVALFQGLYIMLGALLVFGVDWGDPVGALAVLVAFSAVSAGAGMLLGATADNDAQAGGLGVGLGLGLAALGGSMAPMEIFPETMQRVAHVTPHAWANDAFADLVRRDLGVSAVLPEVAVLAAMAAVLLGLASWRLRVVTTG